jgi:type IV pilus assembly protein PilY1
MSKLLRALHRLYLDRALLACVATSLVIGQAAAQTTLSDTPVYSTSNVPANLMLALSVEYPTGTVGAYTNASSYAPSTTYLGYFDPTKCYDYNNNTGAGYFMPINTSGPACSGHWSGNMLNWALMTSLDEFRQALTGGNRIVDTSSTTVLERSNLNAIQSSTSNFPNKQIGSSVNVSPSTVIGDSNYSSLTNVYLESAGQGITFIISNNSSFRNSGQTNGINNLATTYNAEVAVCVASMLESNCNSAHKSTDYVGAGAYNKPEGLIQQNYTKIRVGASAYAFLNGSSQPNGAVRALLRDNGPTTYNGYGARQTNSYAEWDSKTGIFYTNPDAADSIYATAPGGGAFPKSGAINYLNQFGYQVNYELYDTVSDLYWATLAYYMQVPLDSTYTAGLSSTNSADPSFPVFTGAPANSSKSPTVNDPIQYTCQNNAIVTIGDSHTWYDTRVPTSAPASQIGAAGTPLTPLSVGGTVAVGWMHRHMPRSSAICP